MEQQITRQYTQHHKTASMSTYPCQSQRCKQAHIRTSSLLSNNYYKLGPSNTDLTPAKPITNNYSRTETQKSNSWELRNRPALYYPSNSTESSKQTQGWTTEGRCLRTPQQLQANVQKQYPNEASQQEESNATTLTSIGDIYRRQSKKIRINRQFKSSRLHTTVHQPGNHRSVIYRDPSVLTAQW
ncbi:hypothetical protein F511_44359 [Dorcoceras hygrometricum]|uniref:Uncharacterized protein n=1 Tax=Dorcoceras hygrometricum TaxID=472368 RepID=A0A2Z7DDN6_9LAMI|nr:hypothetical protein F511_44359 [Dorcoceras hygrometricum]